MDERSVNIDLCEFYILTQIEAIIMAERTILVEPSDALHSRTIFLAIALQKRNNILVSIAFCYAVDIIREDRTIIIEVNLRNYFA